MNITWKIKRLNVNGVKYNVTFREQIITCIQHVNTYLRNKNECFTEILSWCAHDDKTSTAGLAGTRHLLVCKKGTSVVIYK